jgi:lipopolysaccharide export system protein LptA
MRSKTLVVFYDDDAPSKPGAPAAGTTPTGPQQNQQIKRVEARGDVLVVQKDQRATGQSGIFDMRANTVTLVGNVVISQGPNVLTGETLTVDMTTGVSRITGIRVRGLFQPGSMKQEGHPQEAAPAPPRETPRQRSSQPKGLSPQGLY